MLSQARLESDVKLRVIRIAVHRDAMGVDADAHIAHNMQRRARHMNPIYNNITMQLNVLQYNQIYYNAIKYITMQSNMLQCNQIYYNAIKYITIQ